MGELKEKLHTILEIARDIFLLYSIFILIVITFAFTVTDFWLFSPFLLLSIIIILFDRRKKKD